MTYRHLSGERRARRRRRRRRRIVAVDADDAVVDTLSALDANAKKSNSLSSSVDYLCARRLARSLFILWCVDSAGE